MDRPEVHCTKRGGKSKIPVTGDRSFVVPYRQFAGAWTIFFVFLHLFLDDLMLSVYNIVAKSEET